MNRSLRLLVLIGCAAPAVGVQGQDVRMLGERYGTPVPEGYERSRRLHPRAFEFRRGWRAASADIATFEGASSSAGPSLTLGPRSEPVEGTYELPIVLGMYSNSGSTPPFPRSTIQSAYFSDAPGTITHYYSEVSGDRVTLLGNVFEWVQTARPDTAYTVGESGLVSGPLGGGGAGNFVWELLTLLEAQGGIDWGMYDNDGPDGVPNSGDDDGFVDVLAVVHPTRGGECGGSGSDDRIWSHRWTLRSAVGRRFVTNTPRAGGGFVRIDDYTIQPSISCSGGSLNEIGVFTHELGHAFGLPDLYDTCNDARTCPEDTARTSGAGIWDLMASGSWGCDNNSPASPCHLGAWSKAMLGWVDVVTLGPDADHGTLTLPPVEESGTVYRIDANDGSGEYFLLENRQRIGYDQNLLAPGLLVWQIDQDWVSQRWIANRVNANAHQGVWLRQADGQDHLGRGVGRGDGGDPFPGTTHNTAFHAGSDPGTYSYEGTATGLTVLDVGAGGGLDLTLRVLTRFSRVTLTADGSAHSTGLFAVDGESVDPPATVFSAAPFVEHVIEASAGEPVGPGERRPFVGWQDDVDAPRTRPFVTPLTDTELVAMYGGTQFELTLATTGGVNGVEPAMFSSLPASEDFWFEEAAEVTLQAQPRTGFAFSAWSGALEGHPNPAVFSMTGPLTAEAGFTLVYAVTEADIELPAAQALAIQLEVESGTAPVTWRLLSGALPRGTNLSRQGVLGGASLEPGRFVVEVEAVDAVGLPATGSITLDFVDPSIPIEQLASTFLLSGEPLTDDQINYLNYVGNRFGAYDIGDFRARVLAEPSLPLSADLGAPVLRRTLTLRASQRRPRGQSSRGGER
jgi:M6 family metalloprotease-like protein